MDRRVTCLHSCRRVMGRLLLDDRQSVSAKVSERPTANVSPPLPSPPFLLSTDPKGTASTLARAMSTKSRHSTLFTAAAESIAPTLPTPSVGGISLENNPRATKLLVDLWLMSAASYRRAGRLDESRGAIQEAEVLDADDPDVWCQVRFEPSLLSSPHHKGTYSNARGGDSLLNTHYRFKKLNKRVHLSSKPFLSQRTTFPPSYSSLDSSSSHLRNSPLLKDCWIL